jgi:hypothetical protein
MARSFAQVFQSMDRAEQLEDLYVTSVKVILFAFYKLKIIFPTSELSDIHYK